MARNPRKINPDLPSTAISFDKQTLALLKRIAAADDRSLASLVRLAVDEWLQSDKGQKMAQMAVHREHVVGSDLPEKTYRKEHDRLGLQMRGAVEDDAEELSALSRGEPDTTAPQADVEVAELKAEVLAKLTKLEAMVKAKAGGKE